MSSITSKQRGSVRMIVLDACSHLDSALYFARNCLGLFALDAFPELSNFVVGGSFLQ